jgi:hypothetical protein
MGMIQRKDETKEESASERRNEEGTNRGDQPNPQNQMIVRKIHTISGGLASGGESTSASKAHARSVHIDEVY